MLSKNRIKYIHSLEQKKYRKAEGVFLAEGPKLVEELLGRLECRLLAATHQWLKGQTIVQATEVVEVTEEELARASLLKTPQQVLGIFVQPQEQTDASVIRNSLCLALDDVQDPGNLGTIIRVADWFGIEHIFCSPGTADAFAPKTVQASMGALARVHLHYTSLPALISGLNEEIPVYGTFLNGDNLYAEKLETERGLIIMGNEGNGVSHEVEQLVNRRLLIPNYPAGRTTSESLNVAVATAIVCAEFRRQAASK